MLNRLSFVLAIGLATSTARAAVINVPGDLPTIQAAIDVAVSGDEIIVAEGEYFENIAIVGKAITLRSTDPNDPLVVANTIINGGGVFPNTVVTCMNVGADTVLSGFVITGGNNTSAGGMSNLLISSPTVTNCTFSGNTATDDGGGMRNFFTSSPTVTNCTFIGNTAGTAGGGMSNLNNNSPTVTSVTNCTFIGNMAGTDGGGIYSNNAGATVTDCTFDANTAAYGGGMFNTISDPIVDGCTFDGNVADQAGGGMSSQDSPVVTNCTFTGNSAGDSGGGMSNDLNSNPTVTDCTFSGNMAVNSGGGMHVGGGTATVTNCSFSGNTVNGDGGGMSNQASTTTVLDCAFSGNTALADGGGIWNDIDGTMTVTGTTFCNNSPRHILGLVSLDQVQMTTFCPIPVCPGDINGDGTVGINDFLDLLAAWGPCP